MGRGIRHKKKGENGNGGRDDRGQRGYKDIVRENEWLENFYRSQSNLCPTDEFDEMIRVLKTDLPASFRITGTNEFKALAAKCIWIIYSLQNTKKD